MHGWWLPLTSAARRTGRAGGNVRFCHPAHHEREHPAWVCAEKWDRIEQRQPPAPETASHAVAQRDGLRPVDHFSGRTTAGWPQETRWPRRNLDRTTMHHGNTRCRWRRDIRRAVDQSMPGCEMENDAGVFRIFPEWRAALAMLMARAHSSIRFVEMKPGMCLRRGGKHVQQQHERQAHYRCDAMCSVAS